MHNFFQILLLLVLSLGNPIAVARAHGGGAPQLTNAQAGPYQVSVWTQPDPVRVGEMHVSVAVSEPQGGTPVLDAAVAVQVAPVGRVGEPIVVPATHETATNKLLYEADLELPSAGQWQALVSVEGPAGSGSAGFEFQVARARDFNWTLFAEIGLGLLTVVWIIKIYWSREYSAARPATAGSAKPVVSEAEPSRPRITK